MTRVLCTSGAAGAAFLAAAIDAGCIGAGRRVLVVANEADTPEVVPAPWLADGFDALAARVDEVVRWNEVIAPLHPSAWRPPQREIPVLARLLAARLAGGEVIEELVLESVTEGPGRTLAALVPGVPITLTGHTLATYSPGPAGLSSETTERITRLLHLDLAPGVRPRTAPDVDVVPVDAFRTAAGALGAAPGTADAVLLGERYAERGRLPADVEDTLRIDTVHALAAAGHREVVFAPHPAAGAADHAPLVAAAQAAGVHLTVGPAGVPHEAWVAGPALVVGTSSTALYLARNAATSGVRTLLDGPVHLDHAERMPLTVAYATLPRLGADGAVTDPGTTDLPHLVDAVTFCLAPTVAPELRDRAARWVARHGVPPYLRRARVESLGIEIPAPPSPPPAPPPPARWTDRTLGWVRSRSSGPRT